MPLDMCPECGSRLTNGLCPRCLVKLGIDGPGPYRDTHGSPTDLPPTPGSVLDSLAATIGNVPHVLLRDTALGEEPSPIIRLVHEPDGTLRYRIDGEIARGGMGVILKGRDPDLGRDVAIKVLLEGHTHNGDMVRRFIEEAQIGGQLQHPGVVPIYELGTFADQRPFFSMKLVKGQTLAELLSARAGPAHDVPRFLSIFAAIAQTMAYSHTRGVIHRDLKPSNVMVGSFGEVQVMDWGLAKVLPRGGIVDDAKAGKERIQETVIATARSGSDTDLSHAGSVLGTPSYMAPEQARGETDRMDERADVFALGSILCEILTGAPAFTGRSSGEIIRKAAKGETADALSRMDRCGTEADLIALVKNCLAVEQEDRPHDAGLVADRITAYLSSVQERLRTTERERAVAVARAVEERKRRKLAIALAGTVLLLVAATGGGWTWFASDRAARAMAAARTLSEAVTEARLERDRAESGPADDPTHWIKAVDACRRAEPVLMEGEPDPAARARIRVAIEVVRRLAAQAEAHVEAARADRRMTERLDELTLKIGEQLDRPWFHQAIGDAFREYGIDIATLSPEKAGQLIAQRPNSVELVSSLDHWIFNQQELGDRAGVQRLLQVARVADPDPWRSETREALAAKDLKTLRRVADAIDLDAVPYRSAWRLGFGLAIAGDKPRAIKLLKDLQCRNPADHWINSDLAMILLSLNDPPMIDVIRYASAAVAVRPKIPYAHGYLAEALAVSGRFDEAEADFREVFRINPGNAVSHNNFALLLRQHHRMDQAIAECAEAIRLDPAYAEAHCNLGSCLRREGRYAESLAEFRRGDELGSRKPIWRHPSKLWVREAERLVALESHFPAVGRGEERPRDTREYLSFAEMSYNKKWFALAARLLAEAFDADPKLAENRRTQYRYNAACAASLAAAGKGKDVPADDAAKAKLRAQAKSWLKAELSDWNRVSLIVGPGNKELVARALVHWKKDADLAGIRDEQELAKLPEAERKEWQALWADVDALLTTVAKPTS